MAASDLGQRFAIGAGLRFQESGKIEGVLTHAS
jgi:hypothetical protein